MHHKIDSIAYSNRLRYLPPSQKVLFTFMLFVLGYVSPTYIQLLIIIWLTIWIVGYAGIPLGVYLKLQAIPVSFWLMSVPAIALSGVWVKDVSMIYSDVWLGMSIGKIYLYLSKQGILQTVEILTRAIALTSSLYFLLLTTPFPEILRVLQRLGCPSLIIELLSLMYRFIFVLAQTASELLIAQQSRIGYSSWSRAYHSLGLLITQLLVRTLENYRQISLGLISRGFTGNLAFWHPYQYKTNFRYTMEAIGGFLILLLYTGWHYVDGI